MRSEDRERSENRTVVVFEDWVVEYTREERV